MPNRATRQIRSILNQDKRPGKGLPSQLPHNGTTAAGQNADAELRKKVDDRTEYLNSIKLLLS